VPQPHSTEWVLAVERAYVAAATGGAAPELAGGDFARAAAACGAVASHYLAVGTPRTFGLVVDGADEVAAAALSLAAHRAWFAPRDVRCASTGAGADALAAAVPDGRATSVAEALAADIVCVHAASVVIDAAQLRRGTHVNALAPGARLAPELAKVAAISRERTDLPALAAGLVDGRQLDEITVFVLVDARIAMAALR
jgi:hypothetical protein